MSEVTPARRAAFEVLRRVFEHGAWADRSLRAAVERAGAEGRERALAQRLAYGAVQRRGTTDWLIGKLARRPPGRIDAPLLAALRLGAFELLYDEGAADHAAVDQAVELARGNAGRRRGPRGRGAGLVNAVLRRVATEGRDLVAGVGETGPKAASITHSVPRWIAELWWTELGSERALALLRVANEPAERVYRLTARGIAERLDERLGVAGVEFEPAPLPVEADDPPALIRVLGGDWGAVEAAVAGGGLVPQSRGSAAAAAALDVRPGERVLDLCAAPGIKTTQLAERAAPGGTVLAVERDAGRASALEELCERAGVVGVKVRQEDGTRLVDGSGYDRVLVDAPCSGLGTLASRPDARWRRSADELARTAKLQGRLLDSGLGALRPGGRLVYSVCTISRAEGEEAVDGALGRNQGVHVVAPFAEAAGSGGVQLFPDTDRTDGFFVAALEREGSR